MYQFVLIVMPKHLPLIGDLNIVIGLITYIRKSYDTGLFLILLVDLVSSGVIIIYQDKYRGVHQNATMRNVSAKKLCYRYKYFFFAALIVFCIQLSLVYNFTAVNKTSKFFPSVRIFIPMAMSWKSNVNEHILKKFICTSWVTNDKIYFILIFYCFVQTMN